MLQGRGRDRGQYFGGGQKVETEVGANIFASISASVLKPIFKHRVRGRGHNFTHRTLLLILSSTCYLTSYILLLSSEVTVYSGRVDHRELNMGPMGKID